MRAHDPFDGATRLLVHQSDIEIEVTLGSDASRQWLKSGGLSARDVARLTNPNGPFTPSPLAVDLASRLFEVRGGAELLPAQSFSAVPGESETVFVATYPRPQSDHLSLRATYFGFVEHMRTGAFLAGDEKGEKIATALLSATKPTVDVPLTSTGQTPSNAPEAAPVKRPSFLAFLKLGIEHILSGFDHLLFLCALLIGLRKLGPMLGIITCFTVGHSITLALAALNLVMISSRVIEPLIAASIIVVGLENIFRKDATIDRYWMAGGFGLIHGFGFAGALRETTVIQAGESIVLPLFSFNLGVEVGQLLVAAIVVPLLLLLRRQPHFARYSIPAVSAVVILISGFWLLERTVLSR